MFEIAPVLVKQLLAQGVFRVVAGVGFVGHHIGQAGEVGGQVGVELDARPIAAQVPVIGAPRLLRDCRQFDAFPVRQVHHRQRPPPRLRQGVPKQAQQQTRLVTRQLVPLAPALHTVGQGASARQGVFQQGQGSLELRFGDAGRTNVVVAFSLVLEREAFARQTAAHRLDGAHLLGQVGRAAGLEALRRESVGQGRRRPHQRAWLWDRLSVHLGPQFRRAVVAIDKARKQLLDTQPQANIVLSPVIQHKNPPRVD